MNTMLFLIYSSTYYYYESANDCNRLEKTRSLHLCSLFFHTLVLRFCPAWHRVIGQSCRQPTPSTEPTDIAVWVEDLAPSMSSLCSFVPWLCRFAQLRLAHCCVKLLVPCPTWRHLPMPPTAHAINEPSPRAVRVEDLAIGCCVLLLTVTMPYLWSYLLRQHHCLPSKAPKGSRHPYHSPQPSDRANQVEGLSFAPPFLFLLSSSGSRLLPFPSGWLLYDVVNGNE